MGFVEEGLFRCYLQFTLTRGINFWWALGVVAVTSAPYLGSLPSAATAHGASTLALRWASSLASSSTKRLPHAVRFWQAAWVTSTLFGFVHTGNGGENWIGIFAAAFIGFVFCVSVRLTGSAWWAIGCHAGWDWAETFFYGAADSGLPAQGHYLTSSPPAIRCGAAARTAPKAVCWSWA